MLLRMLQGPGRCSGSVSVTKPRVSVRPCPRLGIASASGEIVKLRGDGDEALESAGKGLDAAEVDLGQPSAAEVAARDPLRERGHGREGDVLVRVGQRSRVAVGSPNRGLRRRGPKAGQARVETRCGRDMVFEGHSAPGAGALDLTVEIVEHELSFLAGVVDADEAFRRLDGLDRDGGVLHAILLAWTDRNRPPKKLEVPAL